MVIILLFRKDLLFFFRNYGCPVGSSKVFTVIRYRAQWDFLSRPEGKILIYALSLKIVNSCFYATMAAKGGKKKQLSPR